MSEDTRELRPTARATRAVLFFSVVAAFAFGPVSCGRDSQTITRTHMFSLDIGRMEDQVDIVQYEGAPFENEVNVALRDGIFYVTDATSRKIMQFNSYGDLLMLVYAPQSNPEPVLLSTVESEGRVTNRRAVSYPFEHVGSLGVSSAGTVFVEDYVDASMREMDTEARALLRSVILRFNGEGRLVDSIFQNGDAGSPFPFVEGVYATADDGVVVVSRTSVDRRVYAFDRTSSRKYAVSITSEDVPGAEPTDIASLSRIVPDPSGENLLLKVDYYGTESDEAGFSRSELLVYDPFASTVGSSVELPAVTVDRDGGRLAGASAGTVLFELVGVARGTHAFCIAPVADSRYRLLIVDAADGETVYLEEIEIEDTETVMRTFHVSPQGILTALLAQPLEVEVLVWRFDRVVKESLDEAG